MTYDTTLTIKIQKDLKRQAKEFFARKGENLSDVITTFLSTSIFWTEDEQVIFTRIEEEDLTAEEKASLEEMQAMKPEDFVVSTNPYHVH